MTLLIFFGVSFAASTIGAICGIGGGVIIKPVMDALGIVDVPTISFLSSFTVLCMSAYSAVEIKSHGKMDIQASISLPLSVGGAFGGVIGNSLFNYLLYIGDNTNAVGGIQAISLIIITLGALIYTINKSKITTYHVKNVFISLIIGTLLGMFSSFLGIGGGPINLVVLFFFYSMSTKIAVENSLYIIFFSQLANILQSLLTNNVPEFEISSLILMGVGGVLGGIAGRLINEKIKDITVNKLFIGLMFVIIFINVYNFYKFF